MLCYSYYNISFLDMHQLMGKDMMYLLLVLSLVICLSSSQSLISKYYRAKCLYLHCLYNIAPAFYDVYNSAPFNGSNLTTTGANCTNDGACSFPSKLSDGDFGPMDSLTGQLSRFFAFNQTGSRLNFIFTTTVLKVVVYFFNFPTDAIGLPLIKVFLGNQPVPYFFTDNDDLTQTDSQLRTVTLQHSQELFSVRLDFIFPNNSRIDWFLISEVQFYNGKRICVHIVMLYCINRYSHISSNGRHYI